MCSRDFRTSYLHSKGIPHRAISLAQYAEGPMHMKSGWDSCDKCLGMIITLCIPRCIKWLELCKTVQSYKYLFADCNFSDCCIAAVESGQIDVLKRLLQYGANVNGFHSMCGWNSLHQASFQVISEFFLLHFHVNWMSYFIIMAVLYSSCFLLAYGL